MARTTAQRVVTASAHSTATREFIGELGDSARREGWTEAETFRRWLIAASCALKNPVLQHVSRRAWDDNEDRYMAVVKLCRHPQDTMMGMTRLLSRCGIALMNDGTDFLGPIFMELSANAQGGQFFTPPSLSESIARMVLHDASSMLREQKTKGKDYLSIAEPACGVGGMVLEANKVLMAQGLNPAHDVMWTCTDVDERAVQAAYIQLTLTNTAAFVVHGNTITMECWENVPTMAALHRLSRPAPQLETCS